MATLQTKINVGVADAGISDNPADVLITRSLGSCIGVCVYDKTRRIGGLLHFLLPSSEDCESAIENPFKFCDTGMTALLEELISMGAKKNRLRAKIAGGAKMLEANKGFDVGKRNYMAIRKYLWRKGIFIDAEDVGGNWPRTVYMIIEDGSVVIRTGQNEKEL
ncbi:MAG: chemotaxis protein CheD [Planctomycetota bacterium]|jgi:chemotaxis protein CheD